jgi:hypothetical protein
LAILTQTYFSPRYGFDMKNDMINSFIASGAIAYGKAVTPTATTGVLTSATTLEYFLMEEVTSDGPSVAEIELGIYQYEKKASASTAVSVLKAVKGGIVRTKWVSDSGSTGLAVNITLNVSDGLFITGASDSAGTEGRILNILSDSLGNAMYDIVIL